MRMAMLYAIALIACHPLVPPPVDVTQHAQPKHAGGGTIQGVIRLDADGVDRMPAIGASVLVESAKLRERRSATADDQGFYQVNDLRAADDYVVTFTFGRVSASRDAVTVTDGARVSVSQQLELPDPHRVPNCSEIGAGDGMCFP